MNRADDHPPDPGFSRKAGKLLEPAPRRIGYFRGVAGTAKNRTEARENQRATVAENTMDLYTAVVVRLDWKAEL